MFEEVRDCPHLVQYYKCWQEDCASFAPPSLPAFMYILMECCARGSLTVLSLSLLPSLPGLPRAPARRLRALRLAPAPHRPPGGFLGSPSRQALVFLHGRNVVHLDLKPDNLLFDELGRLRVGDFGCAAHVDELSVFSDRRYMALDGLEDRVTPQRDLFSLGLIAYQLMSREELPVSGQRWTELRRENGVGRNSRLFRRSLRSPGIRLV